MTESKMLIAILVMALMTYLPRVLPLVLFRKKITNKFFRSFLLYMPYAVLAAMVIPAVFTSTSSVLSAVIGTIVAFIMAYNNFGLLPVSISAVCSVFLVERMIDFL